MPRNKNTKSYPALRSYQQQHAREEARILYIKSMKNLASSYATTVKTHGSIIDWDQKTYDDFHSSVYGHFKSAMKGLRKRHNTLNLQNVKHEKQYNVIMNTLRNAHKDKCQRRLSCATYFINQSV